MVAWQLPRGDALRGAFDPVFLCVKRASLQPIHVRSADDWSSWSGVDAFDDRRGVPAATKLARSSLRLQP